MAVNPLSANLVNLLSPEPISTLKEFLNIDDGGNTASFTDVFTEAIKNVNATDAAGKASTLALLAGQTDDLAGMMIDGQKAEIALSLALALRNKMMDAYTEIMRMQV
ncbi:MAG: flagellar hook-basal body complex protein FliE [Clostridiales bacterium]|nr:flagellar hook-basal body complex protein FliE [Clostridiales bacterium]